MVLKSQRKEALNLFKVRNLDNQKTKGLYLYQAFLLLSFLIFAIVIATINFFYDGHTWLSLKEVNNALEQTSPATFVYPIASIMCGFSMPMVGLCMQTTTRNQLAEPTTLGFFPLIITGMMVAEQVANARNLNVYWLNYIFAILFSVFVIGINFVVVKGKGNKQGFKAILIGFTISAVFTGVNYLIFEYAPSVTVQPLGWFFQNIATNKQSFIISGVLMIISVGIMLFLSTRLAIIQRDWLLAKTLGIKVDLIYWVIAICSILITVSSMMIMGGIVLLGLVIPHIVRIISRSNNFNYLLVSSGILGIGLLSSSAMWFKASAVNINLLIAILAIPVLFAILLSRRKISS